MTIDFASRLKGAKIIEQAIFDKNEFFTAEIRRSSPGAVTELVLPTSPSRAVIDAHGLDRAGPYIRLAVIDHTIKPALEPYPDLGQLIKVAMVYPD